MADGEEEQKQNVNAVKAHVRLATAEDVPHILALIQQLAEFERLAEICVASETKLASTLFNLPPFQGPTVFLLEISPAHTQTLTLTLNEAPLAAFHETTHHMTLRSPVNDSQAHSFTSFHSPARTVAGFVLFFPNYSTFLAKPGFYIEDLFVRECYRGRGFGTLLLKAVAQIALKLDYGRVEWCVLDWNENAIKFYEGMGAEVLHDWRICRSTGECLKACGS